MSASPCNLTTKRLLCRFIVVCAFVALYYSSEWSWIRVATRATVRNLLVITGHECIAPSPASSVRAKLASTQPVNWYGRFLAWIETQSSLQVVLIVDGCTYSVTPDCTYADLILIIWPLLWLPSLSWAINVRRLMSAAALVLCLNLLRLFLTLHYAPHDGDEFLVHDIADALLYWPILGCVAVKAVRVDLNTVGISADNGQSTVDFPVVELR